MVNEYNRWLDTHWRWCKCTGTCQGNSDITLLVKLNEHVLVGEIKMYCSEMHSVDNFKQPYFNFMHTQVVITVGTFGDNIFVAQGTFQWPKFWIQLNILVYMKLSLLLKLLVTRFAISPTIINGKVSICCVCGKWFWQNSTRLSCWVKLLCNNFLGSMCSLSIKSRISLSGWFPIESSTVFPLTTTYFILWISKACSLRRWTTLKLIPHILHVRLYWDLLHALTSPLLSSFLLPGFASKPL